jgi:hypothetical protein
LLLPAVFAFLLCFPVPFEKLRISVSTSWMKPELPPEGENTTVSFGHMSTPKQKDRSGLPADLGHNQNGVLGHVVTTPTPSLGLLRNPRYGHTDAKRLHGAVGVVILRMETTLSKGMSISMLPIQKRRVPSEVTSTDRTLLYQNQATAKRFATETATTVPWAPIGTAHTSSRTKIASNRTNLALKPGDFPRR